MTLPMPGSGPSGAPASGAGGDLREASLTPATATGRPPWDEMPRSVVLAPPREGAPGPSPTPGAGPHQKAPPGRKARPSAAVPARHSPRRDPAHGRVIAAGGLALLAAGTALAGLFVPYDGATFWTSAPFWSGFAAFCALLQLAPLARPVFGWPGHARLVDRRGGRRRPAAVLDPHRAAGGLVQFGVRGDRGRDGGGGWGVAGPGQTDMSRLPARRGLLRLSAGLPRETAGRRAGVLAAGDRARGGRGRAGAGH